MGHPEIRRIEKDWILVVYDISVEKGSMRKRVLRRLHKLGALQFTESVYYMPYTEEGISAAQEISGGGTLFVWSSKVEEEGARLLTDRFAMDISSAVDNLESKVCKAEDLLESGERIDWRLKSLRTKFRGLNRASVLIRSGAFAGRLAEVGQRLSDLRTRARARAREMATNA